MHIRVEIRNVYGEDKVYPKCPIAGRFANIAGTKTLTRETLVNILAIGFAIDVVDRYGQISRRFSAGRFADLPMVA